MNIKKFKTIIAPILVLSLCTGCVATYKNPNPSELSESTESKADDGNDSDVEKASQSDDVKKDAANEKFERPSLIMKELNADEETFEANVKSFEVEPDLANVYRVDDYYLNDGEKDLLYKNGFVVSGYGGNEFFEMYEINRYSQTSNFITVDSLMHTYHLYFAYLLKKVEKNDLSEAIEKLSKIMAENSINAYDELKDSDDWKDAAKRNVAFFTVGAKLFDDKFEVKDYVEDIVNDELDAINDASAIQISGITGFEEDYTQYKPRGYYDGDAQLEKYFRAMMWYGRIHFKQESEDLDKSALLITKALMEDDKAHELWSAVYAVISFFAGASDDAGAAEYADVIEKAYGGIPSGDDLVNNAEAFDKYHALTKDVKVPQINSIPIWEWDETNVIPGFRFMGQRFTLDASVMQKLIYRNVKENKDGDRRMLPDVLDFPAALGSETALEILDEKGDTGFEGYSENMDKLIKSFEDDNNAVWSASLYANWLHTLRPLLNEKRDGYPQFMQSKEWAKKNLECFAGSYTELKHDTVLYSKQILAEMGGGDDEVYDDRGYVEPEPLVYTRFIHLAESTKSGLQKFNMLDKNYEDDLDKLIEIATQLKQISIKELNDEVPSDDDFDFIREYGGYIEHFWYETAKEDAQTEYISTQEYPSALVTDIATDPNGQVLELATDLPSQIRVIVKVDDKIKFAVGAVYSFYQFAWPMDDRLTDKEWWQMLGIDWDMDNWDGREDNMKNLPSKPEWTGSYRYVYEYD